MKTRGYWKHIQGQQIDRKCQLLQATNKSIQYICCEYLSLAVKSMSFSSNKTMSPKTIHQAFVNYTDIVHRFSLTSSQDFRKNWNCTKSIYKSFRKLLYWVLWALSTNFEALTKQHHWRRFYCLKHRK